DIHKYENFLAVLQQACSQANRQLSKASKRLLEDVKNPELRKGQSGVWMIASLM
ncbi:hypothetical protein BCV72DRAFT_321598, partial [Rhizopus microsporus var. microsporus]